MTLPALERSPAAAKREALLDLLTQRVRVASLAQLASYPFGGSKDGVRKIVRRLQTADLVVTGAPLVRRLWLSEPLVGWSPGKADPDFGALSWQAQRRWRALLPAPTPMMWATRRAVQLCGGCGGTIRQPLQIEHDVHVTEIYLQTRSRQSAVAARWISEDLYRRRQPGGKVPDAAIVGANGSIDCWIEFAGSYSAQRIRSFHRCCAREGVPYELW